MTTDNTIDTLRQLIKHKGKAIIYDGKMVEIGYTYLHTLWTDNIKPLLTEQENKFLADLSNDLLIKLKKPWNS